MPLSPPRPCAAPGCPELVHGKARCDAHERKRDRERGTAHERGYDARWRKYRLVYLAQHPLCAPCASQGRTTAASVVDHVRAHKGDVTLFWDPRNHQPSCKPCHDARTDEGDFRE
jgi:5-methylcytosine-specific restriction protein A